MTRHEDRFIVHSRVTREFPGKICERLQRHTHASVKFKLSCTVCMMSLASYLVSSTRGHQILPSLVRFSYTACTALPKIFKILKSLKILNLKAIKLEQCGQVKYTVSNCLECAGIYILYVHLPLSAIVISFKTLV